MLDPKRTIFFMCDVQKSLLNVVLDSENVTLRISNLYSKGLGNTVNNLDISHALCVVDKKTFSMYPGLIADKMKEFRDYVVVLFGLETHICVLQTALQLIEDKYKVVIVADACSSRSAVDMRIALKRLTSTGAMITTTESLLFEIIKTKDSAQFDLIKEMIKIHLPDHPALDNF